MKISLNWLNDYIDVKDYLAKPEELARLLTGAGLEVEGVEDRARQFHHVVIGHIIELGRHPNADKLTLCQVDTGEKTPRQIVCGAKNHKQGDKVVVATPGAVLPGDFAIKISKIRDVESQGMLCSESELGFKEESEGILILPKDAPVGKPFAEYMGFNDITMEINVTPNRADCLSHYGIARELSTLLERKLVKPESKVQAGKKKVAVSVDLRDSEGCPRYAGRSIFGVKVGPSPQWLKTRVEAAGMNSVNNIVDVTNYVMLEYGQPLHAFDAKTLRGNKIIIEKSKAGETFKSFDGTEFTLKGDELTIRDGERAVALAGIVGGVNSGVSDSTEEIFLEAAHFNPAVVRRTARRLGIDTDSAYRFMRGTDPENVVEAMNRACALIQQVAGGEVSTNHHDEYPKPKERKPITITAESVAERLGYDVTAKDLTAWMKRLHCDVKSSGSQLKVTAPAYRVDIEMPEDLIEEYARLSGYDKIPEHFPALLERPTENMAVHDLENHVAYLLVAEGYYEARNYNFISAEWQKRIYDSARFKTLGLDAGGLEVPVRNPLSAETGVMRQSLLPGLLQNVIRNVHYGLRHGRLFETGYVFGKSESFVEPHRLALVAWGHESNLRSRPNHHVVYDLKSAVESLARRLQSKVLFRSLESAPGVVHPGQCAVVFYEGKNIGFLGTLHPAFTEEHKLRVDVAVCELDLTALLRGQPRLPKAKPISKFPAVERDIALLKPVELNAGDIQREIEKVGGKMLQSVDVFDVFRSEKLPEGKESIAYRMLFQDFEGTLDDKRMNELMSAIVTSLTKKFDVSVR